MQRLLEPLSKLEVDEFTIELCPSLYNDDIGRLFVKFGVNRISLSVQSFNSNLLTFINHNYDKIKVYDTLNKLKSLNISNISVDMLYGIPGQTISMLKADLEEISKLDISHVSYYNLVLEEGTHFYYEYMKGNLNTLSNDMESSMFDLIKEMLIKQGFSHYEITNYCRNQKESIHNKKYWKIEEYIGIGLGAHSYLDHTRFYNSKDINEYINKINITSLNQTQEEIIQDTLIMGLHLLEGVNVEKIEVKYSVLLFDLFPELYDKISQGLVEVNLGYLRLTSKGIKLANEVFEVFV